MRRRDVRITGAALFFAASVLGNSFGFVEAVGGQDSENEITQYEGYELVWNDEFDGEYLDDTKWRIGNTPENGSHKYNTAQTEEGTGKRKCFSGKWRVTVKSNTACGAGDGKKLQENSKE